MLITFMTFQVRHCCFCRSVGDSISLHHSDSVSCETYIYSSLFTARTQQKYVSFRRKSICLLLLISGDIEQCPGPEHEINADFADMLRGSRITRGMFTIKSRLK